MNTILTGNEIQTAIFFSQGKEMKVHAIQTGLISVKEKLLKAKRPGFPEQTKYCFRQ